MTDQTWKNRTRENAKLLLRRGLQRADLDLRRGSYAGHVVATTRARYIDTVLDVGANVGQYASLLRGAGFTGRVISCEPLEGAYAQLAGRAEKDPSWTTMRVAVGAQPGTATMNVAANSFSSSLLGMTDAHRSAAPGSDYVATEEVELTTVADLVDRQGIDPARALLKIDTQGFEAEVLAGAGDLLGRFDAVQLELSFVELYDGQPLYDQMLSTMTDAGYRIHQLEPGFSDTDGRLMQVDGLFVLSRPSST